MKYCCISIFLLLGVLSCTPGKKEGWSVYHKGVGTYSSPRAADLNKDGVLDIVIGAGGHEDYHSDTAVLALDGVTGRLLWRLPGNNQYVGSAVFNDVTGDSIPDVFIGGRWAQLTAINGATGAPLWQFYPQRAQPSGADAGWYNFTTPQVIPDQDGDGLADLLIANGGNPLALPGDTARPAGRILVLSAKTGAVLANATVPDGRETYMSVVCLETGNKGDLQVLVGTGGETVGGHLYRTTLKDIMAGDISGAEVIAGSETKGFIAPPTLADVNADSVHDIIVNAVDGRMIAIDGSNLAVLWQVILPGTEAYTTPAVGYFNADAVPDLFCNFAIGTFPALTRSVRFMVDGKTGRVAYRDTVPSFQYASAVAADLTGDEIDEVVMHQSAVQQKQFEEVYYSYLQVFDFKNNRQYALGDTLPATNLAATPWIGDLDNNGRLDLIYSAVKFHDVTFDLQQPLGMYISRWPTGIAITKPVVWGAYMGSHYTGVFPLKGK